jgi:hypothetical protein
MVVTYFKAFISIHVEGFRNVKHVPSEFGSQHLPDGHDIRYCSSHHALSPRWEDMAVNHWVLLPVSVCGPGIATFKSPFGYPWFQVRKLPYLMQVLPVNVPVRFHKFEVP